MAFWGRETRTKESEESIVDRAFASWSEARREKDDESVATVLTLTHKMNDAREALEAAEKSLEDAAGSSWPKGKKIFVRDRQIICDYCDCEIWEEKENNGEWCGEKEPYWFYQFYCKVCRRYVQVIKEYGDGQDKLAHKYTINSEAEYNRNTEEENERYRKEKRALESDEIMRFE